MRCLDYVGLFVWHEDTDGLEYVLDIDSVVSNVLTSHRIVNNYSGRNYLFEVAHRGWELFDAARVGNATRFLNHDEDANCEARSKFPGWS